MNDRQPEQVGWYVMLDMSAVCARCAASPDEAKRAAGFDDDPAVVVSPVTGLEAREGDVSCRICGRPLALPAPGDG